MNSHAVDRRWRTTDEFFFFLLNFFFFNEIFRENCLFTEFRGSVPSFAAVEAMATSHGPVLPSFTEFRGKKNRFLPSCYRVFFFFVLKNTISKKRRERKNSVPSFTEFRGPSYRVSRGKKIDFYRVFTEFFFLEFFLSFRVWQGANKKKQQERAKFWRKKNWNLKKKLKRKKREKKKASRWRPADGER